MTAHVLLSLLASAAIAQGPPPTDSTEQAKRLLNETAQAYEKLPAYADEGTLSIPGGGDPATLPVPIRFIRPNRFAIDLGGVAYFRDESQFIHAMPPYPPLPPPDTQDEAPRELLPEFDIDGRLFSMIIPDAPHPALTFRQFRNRPDENLLRLAAAGVDLLAWPVAMLNGQPLDNLLPIPEEDDANPPASPPPTPPLPPLSGSLKPDALKLDSADDHAIKIRLVYNPGPDLCLEIDPATKLFRRAAWILSPEDLPPGSDPKSLPPDGETLVWSAGTIQTDPATVATLLDTLRTHILDRLEPPPEIFPPIPHKYIPGKYAPSKVLPAPAPQWGSGAKTAITRHTLSARFAGALWDLWNWARGR